MPPTKLDIVLESQKLTVDSPATLLEATSLLSSLNKHLDTLQAHKEEKTRPINEALKKIRQDYAPREALLKEAITTIRQKLTEYATKEEAIAKQEEARILADGRTNLTTKINQLSNITPNVTKSSTTEGSITFTTIIRYVLKDATTVPIHLLELNTTLLKAFLKEGNPLPEGIERVEEKSLRNTRN